MTVTTAETLQKNFDAAENIEGTNLQQSITGYSSVIREESDKTEESNKIKENAIYKLGKIYAKNGQATSLFELLREVRPFFDEVAKARTAKIVRTLIDLVSEIPGTGELQIQLCKECIEWCTETKRNFLRQRIETKLASLYLDHRKYQEALDIITVLVREVKRLDDKLLLVEIQLIESRIHLALHNLPRSKASLTAARTSANSIYCPPALQTQLDMQSGILHAEERDYKTAYSYFFESFEGFSSQEDAKAVQALKYMLLCKIMTNNSEDVGAIINGKVALRYAGSDVEAMRTVANAHRDRSLQQFEAAKQTFKNELGNDPIVDTHLSELYETLLEQNLCRLIEPYSVVEIQHIASLIKLPQHIVENKLSQMILDKKFLGILDQGVGQLIVFDESPENKTYTAALGTFDNMSQVVDSLYSKTNKLG
eukprot:TRINITY_DN12525_c0_g1_i1.p1 TRINITY_DN12525_c0_g1~~TRINITY_DN12525_c0_g1_i1.p1  ORF type:complete len:425 (-),score=138.08 TRINITY_DN12525_c0_g1_i1:136-1410(-)